MRVPTVRNDRRSIDVLIRFFAPLATVVATAAVIATAPAAAADSTPDSTPNQTCTSLGGTQTQCQAPGNVQINDAPPQVNYFPLGDG
jgi:hypothetical protein